MSNETPDWFIPFEDLFDEHGSLRPFRPSFLDEVENAIESLRENLSNLTEDDVPRLALAIAETSLGLRYLNQGTIFSEGTLKSPDANLTESEQKKHQQIIKDTRQLASQYQEYFDLLVTVYARLSGRDLDSREDKEDGDTL